jgi:hypothetical protein
MLRLSNLLIFEKPLHEWARIICLRRGFGRQAHEFLRIRKFASRYLFYYSTSIILLSGSVVFAQSAAPTIEAKVNKDKVKTGEIFVYSLKIEGSFKNPKLSLPDFKDFQIVTQNQVQNYITEAGRVKTILSLEYRLAIPKPGKFKINAATINDSGRIFKSKIQEIEVTGEPIHKRKELPSYLNNSIDI